MLQTLSAALQVNPKQEPLRKCTCDYHEQNIPCQESLDLMENASKLTNRKERNDGYVTCHSTGLLKFIATHILHIHVNLWCKGHIGDQQANKNEKNNASSDPGNIRADMTHARYIYLYIYHKNQPNVGKSTIHRSYGILAQKIRQCHQSFFMAVTMERIHVTCSPERIRFTGETETTSPCQGCGRTKHHSSPPVEIGLFRLLCNLNPFEVVRAIELK